MEEWQPTRHGGFRRHARLAQQVGKLPGTTEQARGAAAPDVEAREESSQYLEERSPNTGEVGGSSPSPRTKKFQYHGREQLGLPTCPYLIRWRVETPWFSVRLHHWIGPDDDRHKHDHPWSFTTFVLKGGYTDSGADGDEHLRAPAIKYRPATHQHTVFPDPGGCWTIIVTGKKVRTWGFWVDGKFRRALKYFYKYGHHPCD